MTREVGTPPRSRIVATLLGRYGRRFADEAGIRLAGTLAGQGTRQ